MQSYGIIGLGKMGGNLAHNVARFVDVHVTNRGYEKVVGVVNNNPSANKPMTGHITVEVMISEMERPRTVMTVLPSGKTTDHVAAKLCDLLDEGDTMIDLANDHYTNSEWRDWMLDSRKIDYLDCGISGGSLGALEGPSLMIGGSVSAYERHKDFLDKFSHNVHISERAGDGHFTKMAHNGVEYVMLQALADIYNYANKDVVEFDAVMNAARSTCVDGFLVDCAMDVGRRHRIDEVTQVCEMNDTGLWCAQYALEHRLPLSLVTQSVLHRIESTIRPTDDDSMLLRPEMNIVSPTLAVDALQFMYAMALLEGHELLSAHGVPVHRAQMAWGARTIVECPMIRRTYEELTDIVHNKYVPSKIVLESCITNNCSVPMLSASVQKYVFMNDTERSTSLTMAQRNSFGGHKI